MRLKWSRNHEHSGAEGCQGERDAQSRSFPGTDARLMPQFLDLSLQFAPILDRFQFGQMW
jgi:hypothetical protein